jgi:hypothetical protein
MIFEHRKCAGGTSPLAWVGAFLAGVSSLATYTTVAHADELNDELRSGYCWQKVIDGKPDTDHYLLRGFDLYGLKLYVEHTRRDGIDLRPVGYPLVKYRKVPCPQPKTDPTWEIGPEAMLALQYLFDIENSVGGGLPTFESSDRNSGVGGGVIISARVPVGNPDVAVKPFASIDFMNATVQHTFAGGSTLGTKERLLATAGVKAGPTFSGTWLYVIAAGAAMNEELHVNFLPVNASTTTTVAGAAAGAGVAFAPTFLQGLGVPASLFIEYQHLWYQDAHFDRPLSSVGFNYTYRRQDDLVKLGVTFALGGATVTAPTAYRPDYPVKALPLK